MKKYLMSLAALWMALFAIPVQAQRVPMPYAKIQLLDNNGKPCSSCKLYSYIAGTTTLKATYQSSGGSANTNPVILDASGRADVWLASDTSYKLVLKDSADVQIWSVDSITDYGGLLSSGTSDLAGDVTGDYDDSAVVKIQGETVSSSSPSDGEVLKYVTNQWEPGSVFDYTIFTGPTTSDKTFTLPDQTDDVATWDRNNVFTVAQTVTPTALTVNAGDGTIATDASASNHFQVTLDTNCPCTLSTPTNPVNGQVAKWEVIQAAGGSETMAFSAAFAFGTDVTSPTITITADKRDFITATYSGTTSKWYVTQVSQGY